MPNVEVSSTMSIIGMNTGIEKGLEYLAQFQGMEAVMVDNHQHVFVTQGIRESFQIIEGIEVSIIKKGEVKWASRLKERGKEKCG